ncbi:universal stress protein [Alcaligenes nematophilus]|uniref:Universal stress protein n=1 Tax=Alcaligenes phenolicus TaxID=232846 RepID=A0AAW5W2Y8_9BURK|nr:MULTISPECIES: universal stress protein [Alcaligenes]EJC65623.1 universal stress protein UspA [Alcaligenes faecalis subsp. faecalis NCIB 8687]EKU31831.1 universal stress protein UspA [Alcaligenes sp. HPC1271]ERI34291.1 universal stress protein UspA [Alcaligenes sp. EGD-AK7]MCX5567478.1 universal stress protein [Alcaligenes phenolicus]
MIKILACIDTSSYADSVCDLTAWAAQRLLSSVELLHVVQRKSAVQERYDRTGAIGLGVKTDLLEELTRIEEAQGKLAIEAGRVLLDAAADRLRAAGIHDLTQAHRHGGIVETILEREKECDLLVMGNRGASAEFAIAHLGSKIERVVRASKKPILIAPSAIGNIKDVILAYDGGPSAKRALELMASSPLFANLKLHAVFVGEDNEQHRAMLVNAQQQISEYGRSLSTNILNGSPEQVIAELMNTTHDAMLMMGAYGHSPLRNLIVGSTTTSLIRMVDEPMLLIR